MRSDDPEIAVAALLEPARPITDSFFAPPHRSNPGPLPIGASSLGALEQDADRRRGGLDVIPGVSPSNAVIYFNGNGESILFARPESDTYRRYVYKYFSAFYAIDSVRGISGYDVDHAASRSSAERLALAYVALIPVSSHVNRSYASIEPSLADSPNTLGLVTPNIFQIMKINNIPLLKSSEETAAGFGLMIAEAIEQKIIDRDDATTYYTLGRRTGTTIDERERKRRSS